MGKSIKNILLWISLSLGYFLILEILFINLSDEQKTLWDIDLARKSVSIIIKPRHSIHESIMTVKREIIIDDSKEIIAWANAIEEAHKGNNHGPHRVLISKIFYLEFNYNSNTTKNVIFEVEICNDLPLAKIQEKYQGDYQAYSPLNYYSGRELRKVFDSSIEITPEIWVSSHK